MVDLKHKKIHQVNYSLHTLNRWYFPRNYDAEHKNPFGKYDREIRKERDWIRNMKVDYEHTGSLEYEKGNPSYYEYPVKRKNLNNSFGYFRVVKRLPHLVGPFELERRNFQTHLGGELIQTKYQIIDVDEYK